MAQSESGKRTAFVLAGGGSLGAVQVGMLAELIGAGVRPDVIVGVSAGALNGAFLAFDPSLKMVEQMAVLWSRMTTKDVLGLSWRTLLGLLGLRDHIASPEAPSIAIEARTASTARLPRRRSRCTWSAPSWSRAKRWSSRAAIWPRRLSRAPPFPGSSHPLSAKGGISWMERSPRLPPSRWPPHWGSLESSFYHADSLCALNAVSKRAIGRAIHAITLLGARELRRDYEHYSGSVAMRFAPPVCPLSQPSYNYSNGAHLIARARSVTRAWIDAGGLDCGDFPNQLAMHAHA